MTMLQDPGRQIAMDYWQATEHVWSNGYPDKSRCALCGEPDRRQHKAAVPEPAKPHVMEVIDRGQRGSYLFVAYLTCGHGPVNMPVLPRQAPKVGAEYDCMRCHSEWLETNWPPLPEAIYAQINAAVPHCPECGAEIESIPFVQQTTHKFGYDADGQTGALTGTSEHEDVLDEEPAWLGNTVNLPTRPGFWRTGELEVTCEQGHSWVTSRLAYQHENNEHQWRILPDTEEK